VRLLTADPPDAGKRLDVWLAGRLPRLSRAHVQRLIKAGQVTLDGRTPKAHLKVAAGMRVAVEIPAPVKAKLLPEDIPLSVIHEDADILVLNKPAGIVTHPSPGHPSGTLVNAVLHHCRDLPGIGGTMRPGLVHRLDKDTTGVLVIAKTDRAMRSLAKQFKARRVRKEYLALVAGRLDPPEGRIETLLGRSAHDRKKMTARTETGRQAVTRYATAEAFAGASLLRVRIETGRTHQIRVHMSHIGHPVIGDPTYGGRRQADGPVAAARQMLHAHRLAFTHPGTRQEVSYEAPLPRDMQQAIESLRGPPV
jgi:23S rRNA pseudouridine1911/1915/1917 synthase